MPLLAERGLAALAIAPRPYLGTPSATLLARADELAFPVLELPENASFNEILGDVLDVILNRQAVELERARAIHERLTAVVLGGGSFADLINTLAELLGYPVAIKDPHGQILAVSDRQPAEKPATVRAIRVGGSKLGEIVAWPEQAPATDDLMAIDQAATVAALQMVQERVVLTREHRHRALLLDELVSARPGRREDILERAAAFDWNLQVPRAAVLADLEGRDAIDVRVAGQPLEDRLLRLVRELLGPDSIAWGRPFGLALLLTAKQAAGARGRLGAELQRWLPGATASIGIGRVYPDLADFSTSYGEASEALAVGRELEGRGSVISFEELGIFRLLHQLVSGPELAAFTDDILGPLLAHDSRQGSQLVATVECYLRHSRNRAATARELGVHYNTLRYRLEVIERLTGGLDRNQSRRLSFEVALQARRLLVRRSSPPVNASAGGLTSSVVSVSLNAETSLE